jgi:3-hexulose-6-phosphate synthase/6-phospho-3-hexuloisomerase
MAKVIQIALDFVDLPRALKAAREAIKGGADWLEVGTPLIKSCGLDAVRAMRREFPKIPIVADMKVLDTGRTEVEIAAKAGADIVIVMGNADDRTIAEALEAGKNFGVRICVDLLGDACNVERAKEVAELGPSYIGVHIPVDLQMSGRASFDIVREIASAVNIPIAVAGGLNSETILDAARAGASIFVVGGAVTKSENATKAVRTLKKALSEGKKIRSLLYKRVSFENIGDVLGVVSTANISDAMHRRGWLPEIKPIFPSLRCFGPCVTVKTFPGDWAKPVEAVDMAKPGEVIMIDAAGFPPAVWGELATWSAVTKKLGGVVINGAIRDTSAIKETGFPAFAKHVSPQAGEPDGIGQINVPVSVGPVRIQPGDWLVGDDDGVVCIPQERVVEVANRAMDVLEKENRLRKEIRQGGTLSRITEVLKWEKRK